MGKKGIITDNLQPDSKIKVLNQQEYSFQKVTQLYQKHNLVFEVSPSEKARKALEKPWWKFW